MILSLSASIVSYCRLFSVIMAPISSRVSSQNLRISLKVIISHSVWLEEWQVWLVLGRHSKICTTRLRLGTRSRWESSVQRCRLCMAECKCSVVSLQAATLFESRIAKPNCKILGLTWLEECARRRIETPARMGPRSQIVLEPKWLEPFYIYIYIYIYLYLYL